jgi:hypothetical protein
MEKSDNKNFMEELLLKMEESNKAYAKAVISGKKWNYSEWMKENLKSKNDKK